MPKPAKYIIANRPHHFETPYGPAVYEQHDASKYGSNPKWTENTYWRIGGGHVSLYELESHGKVNPLPGHLADLIQAGEEADATQQRLQAQLDETKAGHQAALAKRQKLQLILQEIKVSAGESSWLSNDELVSRVESLTADHARLQRDNDSLRKAAEGRRSADELQRRNDNQVEIFRRLKAALGIGAEVGLEVLITQVEALVREKDRLGRKVAKMEVARDLQESNKQLGSAVSAVRDAFIGGAAQEIKERDAAIVRLAQGLLDVKGPTDIVQGIRELIATADDHQRYYKKFQKTIGEIRDALPADVGPKPVFNSELAGKVKKLTEERAAYLRAAERHINTQTELNKTRRALQPTRGEDLVVETHDIARRRVDAVADLKRQLATVTRDRDDLRDNPPITLNTAMTDELKAEVNRLMEQLARIRHEAQPLPVGQKVTYDYYAHYSSPDSVYRRRNGSDAYEFRVKGGRWVPAATGFTNRGELISESRAKSILGE